MVKLLDFLLANIYRYIWTMKNILYPTFLLLALILNFSCSNEQEESEPRILKKYTLILSAGEGGSWSPDANGIYDEGVIMTLTATPDEGYDFDRFEGSDNDNGNCGSNLRPPPSPNFCRAIVLMNSDRDVWAFFKKRE